MSRIGEAFRNFFQHPATKKVGGVVGSGIKTGAVAGAGLMGGLAVGTYRAAKWGIEKTGSVFLLIFPALLWYFDFFTGINGIKWDLIFNKDFLSILYTIASQSPFIVLLVFFLIVRRPSDKEELIYFSALIFLFVFLFSLSQANPWLFVHLLFALFVFIFLLKGFDKNVMIDSRHWVFLFIVVWDVFAFPSISFANNQLINSQVINLLSNKLLFPVWLFYFFTFIEDSGAKKFLLFGIWIFYIGYFGWQFYTAYGQVLLEQTSAQQKQDVINAPKKIIKNYGDIIRRWFSNQIQYAITGKVEQNQYEPLGVYLDNVRSADSKYYEGEDVVVWGSVRARTLDDPVNVEIGCYVKDGAQKTKTEDVSPKDSFPVFTLEEQDFACTFKKKDFSNILKPGSNTITAFADFNFETLAFLKVYFMDLERLRAMARENLDPLDQFGIKDKKPIAIYTNGPVEIGMETTNPLIGVSSSYIAFPTLSMSIQSHNGWEGKIKEFEEIILLLPKGLSQGSIDCGGKSFSTYTLDNCRDDSCTQVNNNCIAVCNNYRDETNKNNCVASCNDKLTSCQNDCSFLFAEEGQQYLGFSLSKKDIDQANLKLKQDDNPQENFEFFRCRLYPGKEVLENSPITTKSVRVKARYKYTVEKPVTVQMNKADDVLHYPTDLVRIDQKLVSCQDSSCLLQKDAYNKLIEANNIAKEKGFELLVYSPFRNLEEERELWQGKSIKSSWADVYTDPVLRKKLLCNPDDYSNPYEMCNHMTGKAVDLMIKGKSFDQMTNADWAKLADVMKSAGWVGYDLEKWHFDYGLTRNASAQTVTQ